jgi:hypothetical protein
VTATQHPRPYKRPPLTDAEIEQLRLDLLGLRRLAGAST